MEEIGEGWGMNKILENGECRDDGGIGFLLSAMDIWIFEAGRDLAIKTGWNIWLH